MASSKSEKKDKKDKHSSRDGVHKSKKEDKRSSVQLSPEAEAMVLDGSEGEDRARPSNVTVPITVLQSALVPFANPLVDDKAGKKVLKGVKKSARAKTLKRGVKEVVKCLRKSAAPAASATDPAPHHVCVLAADISPMDVISHIPVLCEDHGVPYVYVTSRAELGAAGQTKRPTSVVLVGRDVAGKHAAKGAEAEGKSLASVQEEWGEAYGELVKAVRKAGKDVKV